MTADTEMQEFEQMRGELFFSYCKSAINGELPLARPRKCVRKTKQLNSSLTTKSYSIDLSTDLMIIPHQVKGGRKRKQKKSFRLDRLGNLCQLKMKELFSINFL